MVRLTLVRWMVRLALVRWMVRLSALWSVLVVHVMDSWAKLLGAWLPTLRWWC